MKPGGWMDARGAGKAAWRRSPTICCTIRVVLLIVLSRKSVWKMTWGRSGDGGGRVRASKRGREGGRRLCGRACARVRVCVRVCVCACVCAFFVCARWKEAQKGER